MYMSLNGIEWNSWLWFQCASFQQNLAQNVVLHVLLGFTETTQKLDPVWDLESWMNKGSHPSPRGDKKEHHFPQYSER